MKGPAPERSGMVRTLKIGLAEALRPVLMDADLRATMGTRSREIALEFSWNVVAGQYLDYAEEARSSF